MVKLFSLGKLYYQINFNTEYFVQSYFHVCLFHVKFVNLNVFLLTLFLKKNFFQIKKKSDKIKFVRNHFSYTLLYIALKFTITVRSLQ